MMTMSFASLAYENKKKKTRREKFLEEMDQVIPWGELLQIIRDTTPKLVMVGSRYQWNGCCGYISCSNGTVCLIRRWKMRFITAS